MELIRDLSSIHKEDVALAGGKGASLGEMLQEGLPVPPGFVVTAEAFKMFLDQSFLTEKIQVILNTTDCSEEKQTIVASKEIENLFLSATVPEQLVVAVNEAVATLGESTLLAVRSSATAEDGVTTAWAGQLETYLNIPPNSVLAHMQKCFASLYRSRALRYRYIQNLEEKDIAVAVVVQVMVQSEKSGVAFSVHPVTEDENELIIEAVYGLGEAMVSGQITPDRYVVLKNTLQIASEIVNIQPKGLYLSDSGKNIWRTLGDRGAVSVLTCLEIIELSELLVRIEKHYGFPCDVEWAYEKGTLYITQSRPITTLGKVIDNREQQVQYKLIFTAEGELSPPFYAEKSLHAGYLKYGGVTTYQDGLTKMYIDAAEEDTYAQGTKDWSHDREKVDLFRHRVVQSKALVAALFSTEITVKENGSTSEWHSFLSQHDEAITALLATYKYLEPYFIKGLEDSIKNTETQCQWVEELADLKFELRELLHTLADFDYLWSAMLAEQLGVDNELIFALHLDELQGLIAGDLVASDLEKNKGRLRNYVRIDSEKGQTFLESEEAQRFIKKIENTKKVGTKQFTGSVAYPGHITAPVYKIPYAMGASEELNQVLENFPAGSIILAHATGPELSSVFSKASGIISEEGGITSHASVVAREYKIPTMIGVPGIYEALTNGQVVELDAETGIINI